MNTTGSRIAVLLLGGCLAACSGQFPLSPSESATDSTLAGPGIPGGVAAAASAATRDTVPLQPFPSGAPIPGTSSTLVRTNSGVTITAHTTGLEPGAYSAWWVVFNDPSACSGSCGLDDLAIATVLFATGHVVNSDGSATFAARLNVGDLSGLDPGAPEIFNGPGLLNPRGADIHLAIRTHGPVIPGRTAEQIGTFTGGCDVFACANVQAAIHEG